MRSPNATAPETLLVHGEHVPMETNIHATVELLDEVFSVLSASFQKLCGERIVGGYFFPEFLDLLCRI